MPEDEREPDRDETDRIDEIMDEALPEKLEEKEIAEDDHGGPGLDAAY